MCLFGASQFGMNSLTVDVGSFTRCFSDAEQFFFFVQKIRTVELDGKTIKLQIVSHNLVGVY